ncbi:MAG: ABC transporter ATP-binding protein [Candidatus Thermoplasmatota archaeon]|jgi:ABC-2 type transport system ATP-binding protein|nr:ABC transporter ATP-binding protein [Candidatus Thermoplasmatota archaeon]
MIEIKDIRKVYKGGKVAVDGITETMDKRVTTLIGRNGAGKTTLLRMLSTQLYPTSGTALINGLDIVSDAIKIRKIVASIPQEASPLGILSPYEQVNMYLLGRKFSFPDARKAANDALETVGLWDVRNKPSDTLSGGMKRKMFVALALASNAELVFLDEPTTGLDPLSRLEIWSAIKKLSGNVLLTTHYMEEAENLSDVVYLQDSGHIIDRGTVKKLLSRFSGKVRVESQTELSDSFKVGGIYVKYDAIENSETYIREGKTVKKITLDDLFIMRGVDLES